MKAIAETMRGLYAIIRWVLTVPLMTRRASKIVGDKQKARALFEKSFAQLRNTCRITMATQGTPPPLGTGCVVCYNETSFADVFTFTATILPHVDRAAAADAYALIPFARKACENAAVEMVPRGQRAETGRLMDKIVTALRAGERVAWGGEGQLSGRDEVIRFKRGAFLLAIRAGVPVVPVASYGGHQIWPMRSVRVRPGTINVWFGDPIDTSGYDEDNVRDLADHVQSVVANMYAEMKASRTP